MATVPRDGSYRYAKWASRFERDANGKLPQGSTEQLERMLKKPEVVARIQASFDDMYALEGEIRQVLNAAGVSTIQYPFFFAFGRQVWKLAQRISGEAAAIETAILVTKWNTRGLSMAVLETIRFQVFGINAPVGP